MSNYITEAIASKSYAELIEEYHIVKKRLTDSPHSFTVETRQQAREYIQALKRHLNASYRQEYKFVG